MSRFYDRKAALNASALSDDDIRRIAPSVFADDKHASRSARYTYLPTSEVLGGLRANGFVPVSARQGNSRVPGKADYTKHMLRLRLAGEAAAPTLGGLFREVVLVNSHDGTSAYRLMGGMFRIACLNGLYLAVETFGEVRVPHKGNIVDQVIDGSYEVIESSARGIQQANEWAGIQVPREAQLVLAESAHRLRFGDSDGNVATPIQPEQLLTAGVRTDRADGSLWGVHNRIQSGMIQGGLTAYAPDANGHRRRSTTRPVTGIDADVRLNRELAALSERMASLLTGRQISAAA